MPASTADSSASGSAVTVLGLGPMGRALAGAFLDAGVATTVWNRTSGKDAALAARGAAVASSAAEAAAASPVTVVCVVNYDASDAVLRTDAAAAALKGRTLVNLSNDTPDRARDAGAWAADRGIGYLDGAILTPTTTIGTPDASFVIAGPRDLADAVEPLLGALGGARTHAGEEIGRAAAFDLAVLDIFWTTCAGYLHAAAVARTEGISAAELGPFADGVAAILPGVFAHMAQEVDAGSHSGEDNPITSSASAMAHIVAASEAHGIDASVMRVVEGLARRAIGLGHGADGFTRVADVLRP